MRDKKVTKHELERILKAFKQHDEVEQRNFYNVLKNAEQGHDEILKRNAIIIVRYLFSKDEQFSKKISSYKGKRIFKSKCEGEHRWMFTVPAVTLFGLVLFMGPFMITLFTIIAQFNLLIPAAIIVFIIDAPIFLYFTCLTNVPYLVIYENGVFVRSTLCYLRRTYHPIEYIKKVEILDTWHTMSWRGRYRGSSGQDLRGKIRITKRNGHYQELSIAWVTEIDNAKRIIEELLKYEPNAADSKVVQRLAKLNSTDFSASKVIYRAVDDKTFDELIKKAEASHGIDYKIEYSSDGEPEQLIKIYGLGTSKKILEYISPRSKIKSYEEIMDGFS